MRRNLLSINDLSKRDVLYIFKRADKLRKGSNKVVRFDPSKVAGLLFFEDSLRTRIGFEVAAWRLGIKSVKINGTKITKNMGRAESIRDTIRALDPYVSFFCVRHSDENIFAEVTPFTKQPVINCGNGNLEHPTQALIDAYTIWTRFNNIDGLTVTMVGNLKYSRSAHSLALLLAKFNNVTVKTYAPHELALENKYKATFSKNGNTVIDIQHPEWGNEQVIYSVGFPRNNPNGKFPLARSKKYRITKSDVAKMASDSILLNPLPRIDEIDQEVDELPNAHYFTQNELGLYVRMAIIEKYFLS